MMSLTRLQVTLNEHEADLLIKIAARELRDPREQLRLLLRQDLERRGLLPAEAGKTKQGEPDANAS